MVRVPLHPPALSWARRVGQFSVPDLARTVGVTPARITEFENGDALPTFRQLTLLATKLDRPLGFFFAVPPRTSDVPQTIDFRGRTGSALPSDLVREMRRAQQRRRTMLDLGYHPGATLRDHPGETRGDAPLREDNLREAASRLRERFGLNDAFVPHESSLSQVFGLWRGHVERHGVLVFQTTKISLDVFRGLSIHQDNLPVILLNGADSVAGRIFTLFHEVAHVLSRRSGVCLLRETVSEEALADNFAGAVLIPEEALRSCLRSGLDPRLAVDHIARHCRVSALSAAVRIRRLGLISDADLQRVREASERNWERARATASRRESFIAPWRTHYRALGAPYIATVARALEDNRIDLVDATYLLNARLPMVHELLSEHHRVAVAP